MESCCDIIVFITLHNFPGMLTDKFSYLGEIKIQWQLNCEHYLPHFTFQELIFVIKTWFGFTLIVITWTNFFLTEVKGYLSVEIDLVLLKTFQISALFISEVWSIPIYRPPNHFTTPFILASECFNVQKICAEYEALSLYKKCLKSYHLLARIMWEKWASQIV